MNKTEQFVFEKSLPLAESCGCSVYDVEFAKEGKEFVLRVFIDKPGGIFINDCEDVSHLISNMLDEEDPIKQSYCLEVSSPGINRSLKRREHYEAAAGSLAQLKLYKPFNGSRSIKGKILSAAEDEIEIETGGESLKIKYKEIAKANIYVEF